MSDLTELEGATNDRLLAESGKSSSISPLELVAGFPLAHIVNASFTHGGPARFNGGIRRAWYAAFELGTAQNEVAYHRSVELKEIAENWKSEEVPPYIDYLADFRHEFHDIRHNADFLDCLDPNSYDVSQALGHSLLSSGSAGIVYPSVRHTEGICIACFRPPLVLNVREGRKVTFTFVNAEMISCKIEE